MNRLDIFFNASFEEELNTYLLENDYQLPFEHVLEYVRELNKIDIQDYLDWLDDHFITAVISVEDAIQYSSFEVATKDIVEKMIIAGDRGYSHLEIGKILQDDGTIRSDGTYTKYGENHAKTARYLGYLFSTDRFYYVSSIGYILDKLTEEEQGKLYARLFIRTNLFKTIYYLSQNNEVYLVKVFDMLSDKTYIRRRGNIKMLFEKLAYEEPQCEIVVNKIIY